MNAALATTAWTLAACAAGVLASRKHGEAARRALSASVPRIAWIVWAWSTTLAGVVTAIATFGAGVGIPYWLTALVVCGAGTVAAAHAWPRMTGISALIATFVATLTTGVLLWTT